MTAGDTEVRARPRSFATRLLAASAVPVERLSPVEERLLAIAKTFFFDVLLATRFRPGGTELAPLGSAVIAEAAGYALAAAVEVEQPLRKLRDQLEGET